MLLNNAVMAFDPLLPPPALSTVPVDAVVLLEPVWPVPFEDPVVVLALPVLLMVSLLPEVEFEVVVDPVVLPPVVTLPLPPSSMEVVVSTPELWALPLWALPTASLTARTS